MHNLLSHYWLYPPRYGAELVSILRSGYKSFSPTPNMYSLAWHPNSARFFTLGFPIYLLQWDWSPHPLDRLRNPELRVRSSNDDITGKFKCLYRPRMSPMAKTPSSRVLLTQRRVLSFLLSQRPLRFPTRCVSAMVPYHRGQRSQRTFFLRPFHWSAMLVWLDMWAPSLGSRPASLIK